jgi:hypothetical protein
MPSFVLRVSFTSSFSFLQNLAMIEIKVIFSLLLQRYSISVVPGQYIAANTITRQPKNGIRMILRRRDQTEVSKPRQATEKASINRTTDGQPRQRQQTAAATGAKVLKPLGMI